MWQEQSGYVPSRADKLFFHTAFNRGIPITGYLDRDDMMALSNVSRTSRASMRHVLEKRGITLYHANFRESDFYFPNSKLWKVTLHYKGQETTDFLKMVVRDRDDILGYINGKTFVTDIIQTEFDEFQIKFACEPIDSTKKEIDNAYLVIKIRDSIERLQDHSEAYYNLSVKEIEYDETKLGRRSKRKKHIFFKKSGKIHH